MKKPKINLSGDAIKGFFAYHVEKLILVAVIVLVGMFIMWGYQLEGFTAYTPDRMKSDTESARSTMTRTDVFEDLKDEPERDIQGTIDVITEVMDVEGELPVITPDIYQTQIAWNLPRFAPNAKRGDPEVFPPEELEVRAGYGPLAMPNRTQAAPNDPMAGMDALMKAAMAYQEELRKKAEEEAASGAGNSPGGILEGGRPPEFSLVSPGSTGMTNEIPLTEEQREALTGFQPQAAGAAGGGVGGVSPRGLNYVAVTALAPYKKQWDEYESLLKDSAGYDIGRDSPQYVWFVIQRAEVDASGQAGAWVDLSDTGKTMQMQQYYAGTSPDLVDPRYRDPTLTMTVPPIMLRDLTDLSVHSKTPLISLEDDASEQSQIPEGPIFDPTNNNGPVITPGSVVRPGGIGGGEGGRVSPYPSGGERTSVNPYGNGGEFGRGEFGRGVPMDEDEIVDYKLIRFFDFSVLPGKKYQYRVQVWVTDPNHPQEVTMTPPPSLLQEEVIARITALDRAYNNQIVSNPQAQRTFWRESEWSEPSPVVSVPKTWEVLAAEMEAAKQVRIRLQNNQEISFEMPGEEPKAKTMAILWDPRYAADIPGMTDIYRGSVLNFQTDVNVLHPPTSTVVTLPNYKFNTGAMVLDMEGGEPLPGGDRKDPLTSPTEMLVIDNQGNMFVRNEIDDMREFRMNHYEKPAEPEVDTLGPEGLDPALDPFGDLFNDGGERGRAPPRRRPGRNGG